MTPKSVITVIPTVTSGNLKPISGNFESQNLELDRLEIKTASNYSPTIGRNKRYDTVHKNLTRDSESEN